ncbi:unnamed protein product [Pleuronectes platessa]|uniref:Uncharacterized protein n=1 Tax=Pleuronectes platessa TaxID=8262 RepID=A0A9N7VN43_PLEPL|nr:unnamed protein product [Pleuronectes platessa]
MGSWLKASPPTHEETRVVCVVFSEPCTRSWTLCSDSGTWRQQPQFIQRLLCLPLRPPGTPGSPASCMLNRCTCLTRTVCQDFTRASSAMSSEAVNPVITGLTTSTNPLSHTPLPSSSSSPRLLCSSICHNASTALPRTRLLFVVVKGRGGSGVRDCSTARSDRLQPLGEDRAPPACAAARERLSHRGSPSPSHDGRDTGVLPPPPPPPPPPLLPPPPPPADLFVEGFALAPFFRSPERQRDKVREIHRSSITHRQ